MADGPTIYRETLRLGTTRQLVGLGASPASAQTILSVGPPVASPYAPYPRRWYLRLLLLRRPPVPPRVASLPRSRVRPLPAGCLP